MISFGAGYFIFMRKTHSSTLVPYLYSGVTLLWLSGIFLVIETVPYAAATLGLIVPALFALQPFILYPLVRKWIFRRLGYDEQAYRHGD